MNLPSFGINFAEAEVNKVQATHDEHESSGNHDGHDEHLEGGHHMSGEVVIVYFVFFGLLLGGFVREINKRTGLPYSPMVFVLGIFLGYVHDYLGVFGDSLLLMSGINPHGLLMIFIPTLIFEGGFNFDWHIFKKMLIQIVLLAVFGITIGAFMLTFCLKVILGYPDDKYTWITAFMFGSIVSCTDAVAVLALLKDVGAPKKFNTLLEGESLLNDGTSMVLFQVAAEVYKGTASGPAAALGLFCSLTFGGLLLGLIFGFAIIQWLKKIICDEILTINATFVTAYLVFYVAEFVDLGLKVSGIMALVALGLFMAAFGKTRIDTESEHSVHTFWKYIVYCAETIIFMLCGVLVSTKVLLNSESTVTSEDYIKLLVLYVCMIVCRFLSVLIFMPILVRTGYGLTWKEVYVLVWGGIRGAIGLCFALIIAEDPIYPTALKELVLLDMAGCAVMTLTINGLTTSTLVVKMGLNTPTTVKTKVFNNFLTNMIEQIDEHKEELKTNPYLNVCEWDKVYDAIGYDKYRALIRDNNRFISSQNRGSLPPRGKDEKEMKLMKSGDQNFEDHEELMVETRHRFLTTLKGVYWHLFEIHQCGGDSVLLLTESANNDIDEEQNPMGSWEYILNNFYNQYFLRFLIYLRHTPILGGFVRQLLFDQMGYVHEVTSAYIAAHEKVEHLVHELPIPDKAKHDIISESQYNREKAEDYLSTFLNTSFPEITSTVQNRKAAYSLIYKQKEFVEEVFHSGQIDDKEFEKINKEILNALYQINAMEPSWNIPSLRQFLKGVQLFQFLSDSELDNLISKGKEKIFHQGAYVMKENENFDGVYVITRGGVTETSTRLDSQYKERKGIGAILTPVNLVHQCFQKSMTSCFAESVVYCTQFPYSALKGFMENQTEVEEYLWKESLYALSRILSQELDTLAKLDRQSITTLLQQAVFKRFRRGDSFVVPNGLCILLKGDIKDEATNGKQRSMAIILVSQGQTQKYACESDVSLFLVEQFEEHFEYIAGELIEKKDKKASMIRKITQSGKKSYSKGNFDAGNRFNLGLQREDVFKHHESKPDDEENQHKVYK